MATTEAALMLLRRARSIGEIKAALDVAPAGPALHSAIIERYNALAADPRRDPAGQVRAELLRALRPLATQADRERLEKAVVTYEFGAHGENCAGLRAAALLALAELDPDLAESYAVHLLGDGRTEPMSGEPALTAIRFLAARGNMTAVYLFVLKGGVGQEPLGEALRSLDQLPGSLVEELAWRMLASDDAVALVGLFDLLTAHAEPSRFVPFVRRWAMETDQLEVVHFAALQAVAKRRPPLINALAEAGRLSGLPARRRLLEEALGSL